MMCVLRGRTLRPTLTAADVPSLIRAIRAARSLTQEALAREVGVTFSTINGWENGRHRPIPVLIARLLDIAGTAGLVVESSARGGRPPVRRQRDTGP
jgi:transcriptional regulator with XRE-family HTH domain